MPAYDENAQIVGRYMMAVIDSVGDDLPVFKRKVKKIFAEEIEGDELRADEKYSLGAYARAMAQIEEEIGKKTMKKGGHAAGAAAVSEEVSSVEEALNRLSEAHSQALYGSDMEHPAGQYLHEMAGENRALLGVTEAYPGSDDYAQGVFSGVISKVTGTSPRVETATDHHRYNWVATW